MALRFLDSFDWTSNQNNHRRKYDADSSTNFINIGGRYSGNAVRSSANVFLNLTLDAQDTWIIGLAMQRSNAGDGDIIQLQDAGTTQVTFARVSDTIKVYRGTTAGTLLGSTGVVFIIGEWQYIEMKVVIHNSLGTIDIMKEGVSVLSLSSQDTQATGNATADKILFGYAGTYCWRDDLYVCDGTGSVNNDFLGDLKVETLLPNGNGTTNNFVGSDADSVNNYLLVDEATSDDDTTYVESDIVNDIDLYAFANLSDTPDTIHGIACNIMAKASDAVTTRGITEKIRSGGTNYTGASEMTLLTTYRVLHEIRETDPATAVAWTTSGVNALESGCEVTT